MDLRLVIFIYEWLPHDVAVYEKLVLNFSSSPHIADDFNSWCVFFVSLSGCKQLLAVRFIHIFFSAVILFRSILILYAFFIAHFGLIICCRPNCTNTLRSENAKGEFEWTQFSSCIRFIHSYEAFVGTVLKIVNFPSFSWFGNIRSDDYVRT